MSLSEKRTNHDTSPFGSDVFRSVVNSEIAENMKQAAQAVGLSIIVTGNPGEEYSFKHPLEPKMCEGVLEEGEVVVEIDYSSSPNMMTEFWDKVKEMLPGYEQQRKWLRDNEHILSVF